MAAQTAGALTVLACQIEIPPTPTPAARDIHLHRCAGLVSAALSQTSVDLVVLPELSTVDYSRACFSRLAELAEPLLGPSFNCWSKVAKAHGCAVVYGFPRLAEDGQLHICAGIVGSDGELLGSYDKLHLAQFGASMEQEYFSAGNHLQVFELNGFRIAPIICFDIRPPELCRQLVIEHQVDLILHTGAYYRDPSFATWHACAQTRAVENQVYFLSLNRAGEHFGDSLFVPPWIDEATLPEGFPEHAEALQVHTLQRSEIDRARRDFGFLAERLPSYELPCNGPAPGTSSR